MTSDRVPTATRAARRLPLLLLAILIPSATVLSLGLKTIRQERELADKRRADARARALTDARQSLLARLERARSTQQAGLHDSAVAFVLPTDSTDRIVPPWATDERTTRFLRDRDAAPFAALFAAAERAAHLTHDTVAAESLYARAQRSTSNAALAAFTELQAIQVAPVAPNRIDRAKRLVTLPLDTTDEFGVPLSLYAIRQLELRHQTARIDWPELERGIGSRLTSNRLSPTACHLAQTVLADAPSDVRSRLSLERVDDSCAQLDAVEDLASSSVSPRSTATSSAAQWTWHARQAWFTGVTSNDRRRAVIVVRGPIVLRTLADQHVPFTMAEERDGIALGGPFIDAFVRLTGPVEPVEAAPLRGWFYTAGLALVIALASAAAYLLWRDVRRELAVSTLRAEFVSSVSHELRTPLTSIRMYADALLMHRDLDDVARTSYLSTIVGESERLSRLLNNVLDFARIERNAKMYTMQRIDLADVVRHVARTMAYPLAAQGFSLSVRVPSDHSVDVVADADAIEQALLNLVVNAMKYSGDARTIELALDATGSEATIAVTDHGIGIAPEEHERIFERFYRVTSSDAAPQPGAGLGLTIVRHAVLAHGGRISVRSASGAGSTLTIHLPFADPGRSTKSGMPSREVVTS